MDPKHHSLNMQFVGLCWSLHKLSPLIWYKIVGLTHFSTENWIFWDDKLNFYSKLKHQKWSLLKGCQSTGNNTAHIDHSFEPYCFCTCFLLSSQLSAMQIQQWEKTRASNEKSQRYIFWTLSPNCQPKNPDPNTRSRRSIRHHQ